MAGYRLSRKAERRLADIYAYSLLNFGERQADFYFLDLHRAFDLLQINPTLGRTVQGRPQIRQLTHRRHTIFYLVENSSILVVDILGAGQDPSRHL